MISTLTWDSAAAQEPGHIMRALSAPQAAPFLLYHTLSPAPRSRPHQGHTCNTTTAPHAPVPPCWPQGWPSICGLRRPRPTAQHQHQHLGPLHTPLYILPTAPHPGTGTPAPTDPRMSLPPNLLLHVSKRNHSTYALPLLSFRNLSPCPLRRPHVAVQHRNSCTPRAHSAHTRTLEPP